MLAGGGFELEFIARGCFEFEFIGIVLSSLISFIISTSVEAPLSGCMSPFSRPSSLSSLVDFVNSWMRFGLTGVVIVVFVFKLVITSFWFTGKAKEEAKEQEIRNACKVEDILLLTCFS